MNAKQIIKLSLVISTIFSTNTMKAQETESNAAEGAQFTFAYPLGTNGKDAISKSNKFSFNLLYGVNGGLNGLEIGGLANYNHGEVQGVQLAGLANINRENTNGFMWAGCFNLTMEDARGMQLSDLNVAAGDFTGLQVGVINGITHLHVQKGFLPADIKIFGLHLIQGDYAALVNLLSAFWMSHQALKTGHPGLK